MARHPTYLVAQHARRPLEAWMVYDSKTGRVIASDLSRPEAVTLAMTLNLVGERQGYLNR